MNWLQSGAGRGGEKRMGYPVDFVLMPPIYENRFWYHDLIGQIADCWQVSGE